MSQQVNFKMYMIGDNIEKMVEMKTESIDLIYFDPPYNTGRDFYHFTDKMSINEYILFIKKRVSHCYRVLKKSGTLIIHVEPSISHHIRYICEEIFGCKNFKNEIVWKTGGNSKNLKKLGRNHDTIIVYAKNYNHQKFTPIYFSYDDEYKKKSNVKWCTHHKNDYVTTAIHNSQPHVNPRPNLQYEWNGHHKQWYVTKEKMSNLHNDNRLEYNKNGIPRIKRFLTEMDGIPLKDVWDDISNTQSKEKLDYATQKPVKLLERLVLLYTNQNDTCLDIFAGSGTLGRACINTKRNYILIDINPHGKEIFEQSISPHDE